MSDSVRSESPYDVDFSVIRSAIDMGHSMIEQILHGIHYGSEEVRNLLYEECDYVVECKVCRNLFRSFPNFVAHKRVYCQETHEEKLDREKAVLVRSDEEAVIVEPEAPADIGCATKHPEVAAGATKANKPQNSVLDQVVSNQFPGKSKDYQFYTKVAENLEMRKVAKVTNTVTMTAIPSNPHAMVVSYDKGDHSEKSTPKESPKSSGGASNSASEKTSPMAVDDSPPRPRNIADICKRLVAKHSEDDVQATSVIADVGERQTRRSRKSLPRKSTEEFVDFSAAAREDTSKTSSAVNKDSAGVPKNSAAVSRNMGMANKNTTAPAKTVSGTSKATSTVSNKTLSVSSRRTITQKDVADMEVDKREGKDAASVTKMSGNTEDDWMIHCDMTQMMCKKCGTRYEKPQALKLHLIKTHGIKVGEVKCPLCSKHFVSVGTMVRHMRKNHKATNKQVQKTVKLFERRKAAGKNYKASNRPVTSENSSPNEKIKSSPVNTDSALYKALTGNLKQPVLSVAGNISSKEEKVSNEKKGNGPETSKESSVSGDRLNTGVQKPVKTDDNDPVETKTSHTKLKTANQVNDQTGISHEKPVTRAKKETKTESRVNVPSDPDDKPATRTQKTRPNDTEQKSGRTSRERDVKKFETRTVSDAKETDKSASAEKVEETQEDIESSTHADKQTGDKEKAKNARAKSESSSRKEEINKLLQKNLRSKSESTDRSKGHESVGRAKSQESCNTTGSPTRAPPLTFSPLSSPSRRPVSNSLPTSPTTSINSNSCDGYSSKFKMTVKEMAELVESTSLAKFAKERKKKATQILTNSKVKKPIPTKLVKPMKRGVRRRILPVKKVYSTRLSTEDPLGDKGLLDMASVEQSSKLLREMKRLQNSAGLVEDKIYSSSSPALSSRSGQESDTTIYDSPRVPREKKRVESSASNKIFSSSSSALSAKSGQESDTTIYDSPRAPRENKKQGESSAATRSKPASSELKGSPGDLSKGSPARDKSEDRASCRTSSVERPTTRVSVKLEDVRRSRAVTRDVTQSPAASTTSSHSNSSPSRELAGTRRESRNEMDRQRQIEKTNTLRKKMFAALKSVINSKRIMNSREGRRSDTTPDKSAGSSSDTKTDAHNHRTRLATGSIYFNSELLKLSPSKVSSLESSPRKLTSATNSPSLSPARRKLSLSPKRENKKCHERTRSEPQVFSLATGVKKCETCGKVFWKLRTWKNHRCQKLGKKRMLSSSPKKLGKSDSNASQTQGIPVKKARVGTPDKKTPVKDKVNEVASVSSSAVSITISSLSFPAGNEKDDIVKITADEPETAQKVSPQKTVTDQQPSCSMADSVGDSDDDGSDFSGFSKSDLMERKSVEEFEFSDVDGDFVDEADEEMEMSEQASSLEENTVFGDVEPLSEGLVYKSTGKKRAKSGTVEEIWVEKSPEEKNSENRQYVRDPNIPSKVVCQSDKEIDKIIDEIELKCLTCHMQYTSMSNLRRHAIRHLGWKRYKCKICGFTCYDKSECRLHYNRSHGNQLDNKNFLQYYVDLKREASRKRNAKRVTTIRKKETVNSQDEDPYRKPRQTVVVKAAKDSSDSDMMGAGDSVKSEMTVDGRKDSGSKVVAGTSASPSKSVLRTSVKPEATHSEDMMLHKARVNLTNVLKDT